MADTGIWFRRGTEVAPPEFDTFGSSVTGDFNGDGSPDLMVATNRSATVLCYLSDGRGGLVLHASLPTPGSGPLFVGEWNGDGRLDVCRQSYLGVELLFGDGLGNFTVGPLLELPDTWNWAFKRTADLNGDGATDFVFVYRLNRVYLRFGDGRGGVRKKQVTLRIPPHEAYGDPSVADVVTGDVDGDRRVDLVVTTGERRVHVFLNDGGESWSLAPGSPLDTSVTPPQPSSRTWTPTATSTWSASSTPRWSSIRATGEVGSGRRSGARWGRVQPV